MEHTPGPWKAVPRNVNNDGTQDEMSGLGWDVKGPPEPMLRGMFAKAADAKLTAAAPELLAIVQMELALTEGRISRPPKREYATELRAAIAKATGTQEE